MSEEAERGLASSLFAYENWRAADTKAPSLGGYEVPLYTDAHITGTVRDGYGPYQFLNTVPGVSEGSLAPSIILRVESHVDWSFVVYRPMTRTDSESYHGGGLNEEVAALVSLCLGIRLKAGGISREFRIGGGYSRRWGS